MRGIRCAGWRAVLTACLSCLVPAVVAAQSSQQLIGDYRKAAELVSRGAYGDALKILEDLAKAKPEREGLLRLRVGAGFEDLEYEPRRLAGDACVLIAKNSADLELKLKNLSQACTWYRASKDLGLTKAGVLLDPILAEKDRVEKELSGATAIEAVRKRLDDLRGSVAKLLADQLFEKAFTVLERERPSLAGQEKALEGIRDDVQSSLARWQDALLIQLREDLSLLRPDRVISDPAPAAERLGRYRVPPERAQAARLEPAILWTGRLLALLEKKGFTADLLEPLSQESLTLGIPFFRLTQGLILESLAREVRDPGPSLPLAERWRRVAGAEDVFLAASARARERVRNTLRSFSGPIAIDFEQWLKEVLPQFEERVALVRKSLPELGAPEAVKTCLARFDSPSIVEGARPDGYARIEEDLGKLLARTGSDASLRAEIQAGQTVARAYRLFLSGSVREEVVVQSRQALGDALSIDPSALQAWKPKVSPRVRWVLDQLGP